MQNKRFQRKKEDFVCENCGAEGKGNGFTNHCPKCLWSKHVDVNPGDRANNCGGKMKPVALEKEGKEYVLVHQCEKCGAQKRNKMSPDDDFETALLISKN